MKESHIQPLVTFTLTELMNMRFDGEINQIDFIPELREILKSSVGSDYAWYIANDIGFLNAVRKNVEETSAWKDEGYYTDDDIRLAIGRAIMDKFDIAY